MQKKTSQLQLNHVHDEVREHWQSVEASPSKAPPFDRMFSQIKAESVFKLMIDVDE